MTVSQALALALQHHHAGRLAEAEALYRQILAAQPTHGDALHFLGVIAHQTGRNDLAAEWIRHAIIINPSHGGRHRQRTLEILEREGIESDRVEFVDFRPRREYLEVHHRLDIALDTFPYNGGVTTCDALWMGVPVVSLAGRRRSRARG